MRLWSAAMLLLLVGAPSCRKEKERADGKTEAAALALRQITAIGATIPAADQLTEASPCTDEIAEARPYSLVDVGYFAQFSSRGSTTEAPTSLPRYRRSSAPDGERRGVWYRSGDFDTIAGGMTTEPPDHGAMARGYAAIVAREEGKGLVVAVHPLEERLPKIRSQDGPEDVVLEPGRFEGWALLVDPRSAEIVCRVHFSAKSSSALSFVAGGDPLEVAFDDFQRAFSTAIEEAFARRGIKLQPYRWTLAGGG